MSTLPKKTIEVSVETFRDQASFPLLERVRETIHKSQEYLMGQQKPEGYWVGELFVDTTLVSDVVAFMHWTGEVDFNKQSRCVKHLLDRQMPDGGWTTYYKGPSELNATVKAYFSLKLAGFSMDDLRMVSAHATIVRLGGIPRANTYTKLLLAMFGQFPWKHLPIIPSEIILLPNWLYFNIYEMSSWSRAMVVPLSIINHFKPTAKPAAGKAIARVVPLRHGAFEPWPAVRPKALHLEKFLPGLERVLKFLDTLPWKPFRSRALKKAEAWILERIGEARTAWGRFSQA